MLEELDPQSRALGRPFDDTGDVGDDKTAMGLDTHHAEVGVQGGEGIVGHARSGRRDGTNEGGLAGIGQTQQADVGEHLELQFQATVLAGRARRGLARRAIGGTLEARVADAVETALRHLEDLAFFHHVAENLLGVGVHDQRAQRHLDVDVTAALARAVAPLSRLAMLGTEAARKAKVGEGVDVDVADEVHRAAIATVAAIRPAARDELLAAETHAAVATVTGFHAYDGFIDKLHFPVPGAAAVAGTILLTVSITVAQAYRKHAPRLPGTALSPCQKRKTPSRGTGLRAVPEGGAC